MTSLGLKPSQAPGGTGRRQWSLPEQPSVEHGEDPSWLALQDRSSRVTGEPLGLALHAKQGLVEAQRLLAGLAHSSWNLRRLCAIHWVDVTPLSTQVE